MALISKMPSASFNALIKKTVTLLRRTEDLERVHESVSPSETWPPSVNTNSQTEVNTDHRHMEGFFLWNTCLCSVL